MYYSVPSYTQDLLATASNNGTRSHQQNNGTQLRSNGLNAQSKDEQKQGESIEGMLNNFSKALGDIRDIREKRMKSLGNSPRPSPTDQNYFRMNNPLSQQQQNYQQKNMQYNRYQNQYGQQQPMQQQNMQQQNMQQQQRYGYNQQQQQQQQPNMYNNQMNQNQMMQQQNRQQGYLNQSNQYGNNQQMQGNMQGNQMNQQQGYGNNMQQQRNQMPMQNNMQMQGNNMQQPNMHMQQQQQQQPMLSQQQPFTANSVGPLVVHQPPNTASTLPLVVSSANPITLNPAVTSVSTAGLNPTDPLAQQQAAAANLAAQAAAAAAASAASTAVSQATQQHAVQQAQQQAAAAALLASNPAALGALGINQPSVTTHGTSGLDFSSMTPQQQQLFQQMQLQQQQHHLKKMRQRLPHVSGAELRTLQLQIADLQRQQQLQNLQTLRLAQKQEKQAFKYLNQAIKNRPSRTYQSLYTNKGKSGSPLLLRRDNAHIPSAALIGGSTLVSDQLKNSRLASSSSSQLKHLLSSSLPSSGHHQDPLEAALLAAARSQHGAGIPVGTPDTISETGSMKSRSRRTLPYLPPEEPAPLPTQAKKAQERMRAFANTRQSSLDGLTGRGGAFSSASKPRPSSSETNLRKLAAGDGMARPGSALGLLQASSVVSSYGPTSATRDHQNRILESILPPDLRHLVHGNSSNAIHWTIQNASNFQQPSTAMSMKIEDELRASKTNPREPESEVARRAAERRLFGSVGLQSDRIRQEMQRYASMRDPVLRARMKHNLNPVMNAQLDRNRRIRTHRRNLSDPRFSTSLTDSLGEDELTYGGRPLSSLALRDYDPLSDTYGMDQSRSYLGGRSLSGGAASSLDGHLRDTAISGLTSTDPYDDRSRFLASRASRPLLRRSSEGGLGTSDGLATQNFDPTMTSSSIAAAGYTTSSAVSASGGYIGNSSGTGRRAHSSMSGRYPRSWHPSPFASDDDASSDEPQFYKEEKKNRIKMEIARRRQQIEENACLHEELTRLAKLRETAELSDRLNINSAYGTSPMSPAMAAAAAAAAATVNTSTGTSVLKSVDEILRGGVDGSGLHVPTSDLYTNHVGLTSGLTTSGLYSTSTVNDHSRVTDFSPINSDMIDHRSHFRSSSADPTLGGYGNSYMTTVNSAGDPYGGGKYSKYGTMTGTSSLYRKY